MIKRPGLLLLAAAIIAAIALWKPREPQFQHRNLSDWLDQYQASTSPQDSSKSAEAQSAIQAIGTNAIPYLLKRIQYEPPDWPRLVIEHFPQSVQRPFLYITVAHKFSRATYASDAIALLGTNAAPAIPNLGVLARDGSHRTTSARAIQSLSQLGTMALAELTAAYSDTPPLNRKLIITAVANYTLPFAGANACLPLFVKALNDKDPEVRRYATNQLASMAPQVLTNSSALFHQ